MVVNKNKMSLVICTYNREKYLPILFKSIINQSCDSNDYEIVVIDNNSTDSTQSICNQFIVDNPSVNINYFLEKKQGLSYARNRGYVESKNYYIAYLDDDAHLHKDYVKIKLDYFKDHSDVDAIGGKILLDYEGQKPSWESKYLNSIFGFFYPGEEIFQFVKPKYPRGSNMAFKKSVLEEVNGFNVNLGRTQRNLMGGEEKDIMFRMYDKGYKVMYIPSATVYHAVATHRTKVSYVKTTGLGIGKSEKIRTKNLGGFSLLKRWAIELFKWGASFILLLLYILKGTPSKGVILLKFRWWISQGLLIG